MTPHCGSIEIIGVEVTTMPPNERERINCQIGMLFQAAALFDSLLVWENVTFGLVAERPCNRRQAREIAADPEIFYFDDRPRHDHGRYYR